MRGELKSLIVNLIKKQVEIKNVKNLLDEKTNIAYSDIKTLEKEYSKTSNEDIGKQLDSAYKNYEFLYKLREEKAEKFDKIENIINLLTYANELINEIENEENNNE